MRLLDLRTEARAYALSAIDAGPLAEAARGTWRARMENEYGSHRVFRALARQLRERGFREPLATECEGFAQEEQRHGAQCGAATEALGGIAIGLLSEAAPIPEHAGAPPRAGALCNIISICCMSETVAVALIGAERIEMPESPLRELLTRIFADEIGHARFGWCLLDELAASLSHEERRAIDAYLPIALGHLEAHELAHLPARGAPPGGEHFGLCSGISARELLYDTICEVIVPRLDTLGFSGSGAWRRARAA
jgi:hypothetical protein